MSKLTTIFLNTLVVSSLLAAPPAKKTDIPVGLQTAIEATRHAVEPDGAGFKATNPKQNMDLRFEQAAASVRLPDAEVRLRLAGYGRGSRLAKPEAATLTATKNRVAYRRGPLTEWYVNDKRGLEQGFTVAERPRGAGALVVALAVEGGLTPRLEGTDAVVLESHGAAVLRYAGLRAWDARSQTLAARMEVQGTEIRLTVEDAGAVYPVTIDPWVQEAKLMASDGVAGDNLGLSVALSGDTALVGANGQASYRGAAYVYVRNGTEWTQQAELTASDEVASDDFGVVVALRGDTALVSALYQASGTGAVYVYARNGTTWTEQAKLNASDGVPGDLFGSFLALSGDTALVGAVYKAHYTGAAYVYVRNGTAWTEQAKLTASDGVDFDQFGGSGGVSGDTAVVGAANKANLTGAAYVYTRSGTVWTQQAKLTASDGAAGDFFALSVALSGDTALVGAPHKAQYTGRAYVYVRSGTVWSEQNIMTAPGSSDFGLGVAINGDTALVGTSSDGPTRKGAAYVFGRSGTVWTQQARLTASDGVNGDGFGGALDVSGDTALVGASGNANNTGAAYIFTIIQTANLTVTPSSGFPGATLTLSGSYFSPNEAITVSDNTTGAVLTTATSDAAGAFTATIRVQAVAYGLYTLVAAGQSSGKSATAPFSVTPRLIVNPNTGKAGGTTAAQGYGFGASEMVKVYWNSPRVLLFTATADGRGRFPLVPFTIPAGAPLGTNAVFGKGQTTLAVGKGQFNVQ